MTTAAIMQPTYLPWAGYFHLLDQADVFVLLDTVQLDTRSSQVRTRIKARDGNTPWLTVPVHASRGVRICDVHIDNTQPWQRKHWRTIAAAYQHAPYWDDLDNLLYDYLAAEPEDHLAWLTHDLISDIADYLNIGTPIHRAYRLPATSDDRIGRLADLCRHVGADTLIEPTGGTYLSQELLGPVRLQWHDYPDFVYVSIIDLIAWHGPDSLNLIRQQQAVAA